MLYECCMRGYMYVICELYVWYMCDIGAGDKLVIYVL